MADSLIFPVKFDLEAAVRKAQGDADKYLRQLQTTIHSKPLAIDLKIVNAGSGSLNEISKRMRDIVVEWNNMSEAERIASKTSGEYTDRAKKLIAEFAQLTGASETYARSLQQIVAASRRAANEQEKAMEKQRKTQAILLANEKSIANITAKLKYWKEVMNSSDIGSKQFRKAAEEVRRLNQSLGEAQRNVNSLTGQFRKQDGYVNSLVKRLVVYAGFQQINNFLTSVRSVTAEFELQRVSLGAIIQDQNRANQLFSEIKSFALKSPLKILDLTKYVKQVAAYRIETDKLFDTTKRLADVSVGLGVDMGRLVLAYGQVKAASYLRAAEIRQFTEAGIPMLELLAEKFTEIQGKAVSTEQVMDLVSKRAVSFSMVEEIFKDMTDAGGMFYNMQEKQAQTLFGMWSKLGDAAAVMYEQIGNVGWINEGMKLGIGLLEKMMRNWKTTAMVLDTVAVATGVYVIGLKNAAVASKALTGAVALENLAHQQQIIRIPRVVAGLIGINNVKKVSTILTKAHTKAVLGEAAATNILTKGFWKLTAAMLANPWVLAAAAIAAVGAALFHFIGNAETATERAEKLNNSVASFKNFEDTVTPLIDTYNELINKTERTAAEEKKLSAVTHELANRYPGAITAIGNFGNQIDLVADKLNQLYQAEKQARMENTRHELQKTEKQIASTEARIAQLQKYLSEGKMWVGGGGTGGGGGAMVAMSDEERGRILKQIDMLRYGEDGQSGLFGLQQSAEAARRALGLISSEAAQAVEKFGAWKKTFTTFQQQVGQTKVRLFDESTINQFGSLEEALKKTTEEYKKNIALVATYDETLKSASLTSEERAKIETERAEADAMANLAEKALKYYNAMSLLNTLTSGRGTKSDNRLQNLQEIERTLTSINKKYEELAKTEGNTAALEYVRKNYDSTLKYINKLGKQFNLNFAMPTDFKDLQSYRKAIKDVIEQLKMKGYEKAAIELELKVAEGNQDKLEKQIEKQLKELADRISRTKTAKEFYEKILSQTGDVELAADMAVSIYGQTGQGLQKEIATQLGNALRGVTAEGETIGVNVFEEGVIDPTTFYINYTKLREIVEKQGGKLSESQKKILDDMLKNGEAYNKAQVEQWAKDLAKVKDYTDQYIDLYRMTEQRKAEIRAKMKSGELDKDAGKQEIAGYDAKLAKEQQKLQYEAFKNSPMYTSLFENMENATVQSLHNMRSQIEKMMAVTKEPTQLKELQSRLNEIDDTLAEKSPFEVIAKGWQTMGKMAEKYGSRSNLDNLIKQKQDELDALQAELDAALKKKAQAKQFAEMVGVDVQTPATAITPVQKAALAAYQQASADVKKYGDAVKKADNEQQKLTSDATKWANAMGKVKKGLKTIIQIGQNLLKASEAAQEFAEALGMSEDGLELFQDINNVISNTLNFADALIGCIDLMAKTTAQSISTVEKASVILTVISAALQVATAIFNLFGNAKVRKANKEIERQQELLDQLEYTYGRLEKAADKAFGADFVANQKQQQKILLAQQQAYMKQYEAEMSKGKKADKEKAQEFLDKARDVGDQIAEMQSQIAERMTGTDVTSAARDFASAWLEAYATFGNTTDAIKEKFNDMIKNMIVESVMAKVVQNALQPMFDEMNEMYKEGASMTEVLSFAFRESAQLSKDIDNGLTVAARQLEAAGIDIKSLYASSDNITGISRDFATASESSINGLAAMYNTEIHHTSYLPVISANVEIMRQLMEARIPSASTTDYGVNWTDWQNQAMDHYRAIRQYTYETAQRCERAAAACEAISEKFGRAFTTKGSSQGFNVFLKQ